MPWWPDEHASCNLPSYSCIKRLNSQQIRHASSDCVHRNHVLHHIVFTETTFCNTLCSQKSRLATHCVHRNHDLRTPTDHGFTIEQRALDCVPPYIANDKQVLSVCTCAPTRRVHSLATWLLPARKTNLNIRNMIPDFTGTCLFGCSCFCTANTLNMHDYA
jgi:hypothetical protein